MLGEMRKNDEQTMTTKTTTNRMTFIEKYAEDVSGYVRVSVCAYMEAASK